MRNHEVFSSRNPEEEPRSAAIAYPEYTPKVDGKVHGYHVATIDLGHIDHPEVYDTTRQQGALSSHVALKAEALEVATREFARRGGGVTYVDIVNTLEIMNDGGVRLKHACLRIVIFGTFSVSE